MTNGDKLRAMTNKQLASFHADHCCPPGEEDTTDCAGVGSKCKRHWLEWLKKEAIK